MTTKTSYFMRPLALVMCTALAASVMMVVLASPAQAANITVNSLADDADGTDGECTLREAITNANTDTQPPGVVAGECAAGSGSDVIDVGVTGTVQLTGELPDLSSNLEIKGPGADQFTVRRDTGGDYRIFVVISDSSEPVVSISGITISNGKISGPGAGVINYENLTITSSTISGNEAVEGSNNGDNGGGIYNARNLTITNSTISGNSAFQGGGVFNATNLSFLQKTTITNSTISGNSAIRGGGVMNIEGLTVIEHSTITNNTAPFDPSGGVASNGNTLTRTEVLSTIISANQGSPRADVFSGTRINSFDSKGYNLIGDGNATEEGFNATAAFNKTGDQVGVTDPGLDLLGSYGGSTQTHRLQSDSPALDAGPPSTSCPPPATDQRGVTRPQDGNNDATARCDIGSFELDTLSPRVSGNNPKKGATGVLPTANVRATFPEIMRASSFNGQTFKLFEEGTNIKVAAAVSYDVFSEQMFGTHRAKLNPTDPLKSGVIYRAVVTTGVEDLSGNPLDQKTDIMGNQKKSWTFTVS